MAAWRPSIRSTSSRPVARSARCRRAAAVAGGSGRARSGRSSTTWPRRAARYDSLIALWPGDPDIPQCGWGCTVGPSDATFGAGFSSISTDHWPTLAGDPDPEQGYVHEWLHQVEAVYRGLGLDERDLPPLHDAGAFTSTRAVDEPPAGRSYAEHHDGGAGTWKPWYMDWMSGRLRPIADAAGDAAAGRGPSAPGQPIGLTAERWALRTR